MKTQKEYHRHEGHKAIGIIENKGCNSYNFAHRFVQICARGQDTLATVDKQGC